MEETTRLVAETNEPIVEKEEGEITEEMTEPVAKFFFSVAFAPYLTIREGSNRHTPI